MSSSSSRSSTAMDEDKQFLLSTESHFSSHRKKNGFVNWNVAFFLGNAVLLIAGLTLWARVHLMLKGFSCQCEPSKMTRFEPDLEYDTRVTFQPHTFYGGPPSNATNEAWRRLSPPGDGIVEIPNEATHYLPASLPAPNNPEGAKVYGVSMFHQLHCLNFLRFAYYPEMIEDYPPDEVVFHRDHCLDYIRQALMCAGDATFEPLTDVGINGMGATHQCRNFERLFSWAYEHRSDKLNGSGYTGGKITHTPGHRNDFGEEGHGH